MQLTSFKKIYRITSNCFGSPKMLRILQVLAVLSLTGLATQVFAVDLLSGTDTLKGTGKKYLYIAECVISLLVYIQSKNVMVLIGIVVVAIFFNIMLTMTGSV